MNDANEQLLTDRLHRELRQLPVHRAPDTLAPRVLAALAARRSAPWWQKSWTDRPQGARLIFLAASLVLSGGLILAGLQLPQLGELTAGMWPPAAGWFSEFEPYLALVFRLGEALWLSLKAAPPQVFWLCAAALGLGYATCVGLGTLGYRLALNRI
jgi:hypothetical protein